MQDENNLFQQEIDDLKEQNLYRKPKINRPNLISFCTNDDLGLAQNEKVKEAALEALEKHGFGSTSSRYIYTNHNLHEELEKSLSSLKNADDSIIFGSGYLTGTSIVPALAKKGDLILADKLIHSCLIDGSKLSGAKLIRFKHNDIKDAQRIIESQRNNFNKCLIISETVFSMDGDLGKIDELLEIAKKHDSLVLSDDAHGLGIIKHDLTKHKNNHLQMGTLSKAAGGYGGYVCGSEILINYIRNFAKSAIYSTALPPNILAGNIKSLEIIAKDKSLSKKALDNANYFSQLMGLDKGESCIVPIIIGDVEKTLEIAQKAENKGFLISAIRSPTVQKGKSRLRITFSSDHKRDNIEDLSKALKELII